MYVYHDPIIYKQIDKVYFLLDFFLKEQDCFSNVKIMLGKQ